MSADGPRAARTLAERFSPEDGAPLRVGGLWPPRLMLHNVCTKADADVVDVTATVWIRQVLRGAIEALLDVDGPAVDAAGKEVPGLVVMGSTVTLPPAGPRRGGAPSGWHPLPVALRWTRAFADRLQEVAWVRVPLVLTLEEGPTRRTFQWYAYLTPHAAEIPRSGAYDDHPHFRWVDPREGQLVMDGVASAWVELPAPLSSPTLAPACWVQAASGEPDAQGGPDTVQLVPVFPVEPPIPRGREAVGWNGALGGHDPRPRIQALAVDSRQTAGVWGAWLWYWDTPAGEASRASRQPRSSPLEDPTDCVWPEIAAADERPLALYDLLGRDLTGCEVKVNLRVSLPENAEAVSLRRADLRLGTEDVGRWEGPPIELAAGQTRSLACVIDILKLRAASDGRLKLTLVFYGRPTRGVITGEHVFRSQNGPYARLTRSRAKDGKVRTPWLAIDLGTEGTCAAVAFLDGYVPRVVSANFDDGPVYPTRVFLAPNLGGTWSLADEPSDDGLYTTSIKMGLRFGDGAHPGCPDHVPATDVARFFLKRFLLEVKERMAWFPLEEADVVVSFPPRLAAMPRFVTSLREVFLSVLHEVIWVDREGAPTGGSAGRRLRFREEGLLVAVPTLYRDLEVSPMAPGTSRYYWVMDFGGGTTDVCGFLCTADAYGEEHVVSRLTYPQRLPHHLAGDDVTAGFYALLHQRLAAVDLVAGPEGDRASEPGSRRFPLPLGPLPSARSTPSALLNQSAVRELADALKCMPEAQHAATLVRAVARGLKGNRVRTVDGVTTTLSALLAAEAAELGAMTVAEVHRRVIAPDGSDGATATARRPEIHQVGDKAAVTCARCGEAHTLPLWAFASSRPFRFRCRSCGHAQRVQLRERAAPSDVGLGRQDRESTPMILEYRDTRVQEPAAASRGELYVEQDGRTFVVKDWATLRRWVQERRVSSDDLFSDGGIAWQPLRERPELSGLFEEAEILAVDTTQEIPKSALKARAESPRTGASPAPPAAPTPPDGPSLGRDIELFLQACREALERALDDLPNGHGAEVVVLVAGRASQFGPIAAGIHRIMPGRVMHLTNEWVRRTYGNAGQIDPSAGLKTLTANGAGLFALLQSNVETSQLLLSFDTQIMDCAVYLQAASDAKPWLVTRQLDLRPGTVTALVGSRELERSWVEDLGTSAEEPPPRSLPEDTPLTGDLRLVVEGLPEDRELEPYVTIARGTAKRWQGRRARTTIDTRLRTEADSFVLDFLSDGREIAFHRMLPRLELLGGPDDRPRGPRRPPPGQTPLGATPAGATPPGQPPRDPNGRGSP